MQESNQPFQDDDRSGVFDFTSYLLGDTLIVSKRVSLDTCIAKLMFQLQFSKAAHTAQTANMSAVCTSMSEIV